MAGRTIREAIAIALEGLSGDLFEWVVLAKQRDAMRKHVIKWVHDYARNRGVILTDKDIQDELDKVVAELKGGKPLAAVPKLDDLIDDESLCAVCGWRLAASVREGCVRGNCSLRPRPVNLYAPTRAGKEAAEAMRRASQELQS